MMKWDEDLWILTVDEFNQLPNHTELTSINGDTYIKGIHNFNFDVRFKHIAYGVKNIETHPLAKLFTEFILKS